MDGEDVGDRMARYVVSPRVLDALRGAGAGHDGPGGRRGTPVGAVSARSRSVRMIIELEPDFPGGTERARSVVVERLVGLGLSGRRLARVRAKISRHYVFADLTDAELRGLRSADARPGADAVRNVWLDERLRPLLDRSVRTVKADACMNVFGADGDGVVVAVADSGIDAGHPHFALHENLQLPDGLEHIDFTGGADPLSDGTGHGTHVAGIVAGHSVAGEPPATRVGRFRTDDGTVTTEARPIPAGTVLRGVAPRAKLMSLKVLDTEGDGYAGDLMVALERIEEINRGGRDLRVHVVNVSLGYSFDPEWYAAGHSPLCVAVDRLSRTGVVVVAAAGNDGSALIRTEAAAGRQRVGLDQSINDPGNAGEAITVGATHAEAPHTYGVSHFSSRGPTADGRVKPDMVAPGERVLSCASAGSSALLEALGEAGETPTGGTAYFRESSGTSAAAPHVSGAVAALLSVRREFIGRPAEVKRILKASCTDLGRKSDFQGAGLLDVLRAVQSI